jgi:cytochrome c peroxidase
MSSSFAVEDIDQRLAVYIREFKLVNQRRPGERREKLFMLGRRLFHERAISGNQNISCVDCHHPRVMTHDGLPLSLGEGSSGLQVPPGARDQGQGKVLARNTPALFNLHNVNVMFWDGRVEFNPKTGQFLTPIPLKNEVAATLKSALAAQAIFPMVDHAEMRGQKGTNPIADVADEYEAWELIVERVLRLPDYRELFAEVYPGEKINIGHLGEALAEFQAKAFFFADTPYDRYLQGELQALNSKQKIGMDVFFGKGKCGDCHQGEHLSELDFDGVGAPQIGPGKKDGEDLGRFYVDNSDESKFAFRVPPLRNVGLTAPYFHAGTSNSLENVVLHYNDIKKSLDSYHLSEHLPNYLKPLEGHNHSTNQDRYVRLPLDLPIILDLTVDEREALVEFMRYGLTDYRLQKNLPPK